MKKKKYFILDKKQQDLADELFKEMKKGMCPVCTFYTMENGEKECYVCGYKTEILKC